MYDSEANRSHESESECDCIRCRTERYEIERRTYLDTLLWSYGLFKKYPGIPVLFGFLIFLGVLFPHIPAVGTGTFLSISLMVGRGYVGLCAAEDMLGGEGESEGEGKVYDYTPKERLIVVVKKLPTVAGALAISYASPVLLIFGSMIVVTLIPEHSFLVLAIPLIVSTLTLAVFILFVFYVKFLLVPEACFIGGAGVIESLRKSWGAIRLRRFKVVLIVGSLSVVLGVLFFGGEVSEGSFLGSVQTVFSVLTTAVYSALFAHLYLERRVEV